MSTFYIQSVIFGDIIEGSTSSFKFGHYFMSVPSTSVHLLFTGKHSPCDRLNQDGEQYSLTALRAWL